ncbi:MAG: hypothetical protein ABSG30_08350 [Steroidobacteraceae bacterium]|jgi:hypothetical protein
MRTVAVRATTDLLLADLRPPGAKRLQTLVEMDLIDPLLTVATVRFRVINSKLRMADGAPISRS